MMGLGKIACMSDRLESRIAQSEAVRKGLMNRVALLSEEKQRTKPKPGDFSALDMLGHMAIVEDLSVSFINPTLEFGLNLKPAKPNFLYRVIMKGMTKGRKVPTSKEFEPRFTPTLEAVTEHWDGSRAKILSHLRAHPNDPTAIRHKLFGRLSAFQLLDLLDGHCGYHDIQFPIKQ